MVSSSGKITKINHSFHHRFIEEQAKPTNKDKTARLTRQEKAVIVSYHAKEID